MERKKVMSFSERVRFMKNVKRSLKGDKSKKSLIIVSDETGMQAWMSGKFSDVCQMINDIMDKSEEIDKIFKVVALKRILMNTTGFSMQELVEKLKQIRNEQNEEQPSETKEEKAESEQNQQQNEHAE